MNKKLFLAVAMMSLVMTFTSCAVPYNPETTTAPSATTVTESSETSETTTESTEIERLAPYDHTFNPHCISDVYVKKYGEEFRENYFRFCDAALAGEDTVKLDKKDYLQLFQDISRYCLPVVDTYAHIEDSGTKGNNTYKIVYSLPKDEYLKKVDEFKTRVEFLIENALFEDDTELEKALGLYLSESGRIDYDYDALADNFVSPEGYGVCPYRAIMTDKAICQEIAGAFAYLLLQVGVDAITCGGLTKDSSGAHDWTLVRIDGIYYHCDVTFQCSNKYNLRYFGMNDAQRELEGDWDMPYNNIGNINTIWHKDLPITDTRFEKVWSSFTVFLDHEENMLYCYDDSGTENACYFKMPV